MGVFPQVRLHLNAWVALVVTTIGHLDDFEVSTNRVRPKHCRERLGNRMSGLEKISQPAYPHLKVSVVSKLVQVSHNAQRVVLGRNRRVGYVV